MPLFGKSSKSPSDVVRNLKDALLTLEKGGQDAKKQEKVSSWSYIMQYQIQKKKYFYTK